MTKKRIATMATCIALVGAVAVGGTLALLSSQTDTVTNTFTVGTGYVDGAFNVKEHAVKPQNATAPNFGGYDFVTPNEWDADGQITYANLVGNTTLAKDPTLVLDAGTSPDSWMVAKITGLDENASGKRAVLTVTGIDTNAENGVWFKYEDGVYTEVTSTTQVTNGTYIFNKVVSAGGQTDPLFTQLTVGETVTPANPENVDIVVKGVAIEAVAGATFENSRDAVMAALPSGF